MIKNSENQKSKKRSFSTLYFLFSTFCLALYLLFFNTPVVLAAKLYLEPDSGEYYLGEVFIEEIRINTENECVNVVEAQINFPADILEALDFSHGESILTLWLEPPVINQDEGKISFIGGIPGEYCGKIPGDPGPSNLLGKIIFKVLEPTAEDAGTKKWKINFLNTSRVLLSDKLGTEAKLTFQEAFFEILTEKAEISQNQWQREIEEDISLPEPFEIEIVQQATVFEGRYFIIFSTTDKQTGIDHYEVKEGEGAWKVAKSPYVLENQNLNSIIKVKAVDKAGNERIAEYLPPSVEPVKLKPSSYLIIVLVLIVIGLVWWIIRLQKKTKSISSKK